MTSAVLICVENQASSPNLPNLYLEQRRKSLGKPQATDTNRGRGLLLGSISVENPRSALDKYRVVQQIDCIITSQDEATTEHSQKHRTRGSGQNSHQTIVNNFVIKFVHPHISD